MIFLSAQPDDYYFIWQLELQIYNFRSLGIPKEKIHILIGYDPKKNIKSHVASFNSQNTKFANIFIYPDERLSNLYPSSIRPFLINKHFDKYPHLESESIFYHDSDIIFREIPNLKHLTEKKTILGSNVNSYIGYNYLLKVGGQKLINEMARIIGIDPVLVKENDPDVCGAQYVLRGFNKYFWHHVERLSEELYIYLQEFNEKKIESSYITRKKEETVQAWCTDMWVILWLAWKEGIKTSTSLELEFCWPHQPIEKWESTKILHYSGQYLDNDKTVFRKSNFLNYDPLNDENLKYINENSCSFPIKVILEKRRNNRQRRRLNFKGISLVLDLYHFDQIRLVDLEVIIRHINRNYKINIVVISKLDVVEYFSNINNLTWLRVNTDEQRFKQLIDNLKTEFVCISPPFLMDLKKLKLNVRIKENKNYHSYFIQNVYQVDSFFKELVDKLQNLNILNMHQAKFKIDNCNNFFIFFGKKELTIKAYLHSQSTYEFPLKPLARIKSGYSFLIYDKINPSFEIHDQKLEESVLPPFHNHTDFTNNKLSKDNVEKMDFSWLDSRIGEIWINSLSGNIEEVTIDLDDLLDTIPEISDVNFSNGLIGIAFGIELLNQQGFLKIDSNVVLEDFDDLFYSSYLFWDKENISLNNGISGKLLFLCFRNRNINKNIHRYKSFIHQELIQIILDQLPTILPLPHKTESKYKLFEICQLLLVCSSIITTERINFKSISQIIEAYSIHFLNHNSRNEVTLNLVLCCYMLLICNCKIKNIYCAKSLLALFNNFKESLPEYDRKTTEMLHLNKQDIISFLRKKDKKEYQGLDINIKNLLFLILLFNVK